MVVAIFFPGGNNANITAVRAVYYIIVSKTFRINTVVVRGRDSLSAKRYVRV